VKYLLPTITNIKKNLFVTGIPPDRCYSQIVIESTKPLSHTSQQLPHSYTLTIPRVNLNMPADTIQVYDGLLENINLKEKDNKVTVTIFFAHPTIIDRLSVANPPYQLIINFNRYFLEQLFWNKLVIIDPGHGGDDKGLRGPVGLWEKEAVLSIAYQLRKILELSLAKVWLTRQGDENIPAEMKIKNLQQQKAQLYIGLHLRKGSGSQDGGFALAFPPQEKQIEKLAADIGLELAKKLNLQNKGMHTDEGLSALGLPAVVAETATITNAVEEGLLRNSHFQWRTAQAIYNAMIKYFYAKTQS
jgi:N-acetylmuramoyl-L-alanine amidase